MDEALKKLSLHFPSYTAQVTGVAVLFSSGRVSLHLGTPILASTLTKSSPHQGGVTTGRYLRFTVTDHWVVAFLMDRDDTPYRLSAHRAGQRQA